ncbi:site-specific integrase [Variovorax sp. J22R193]|uniref:site-specific integrase n=1 Tax=Variovorax fucosicus TaxID=3053517 RepID=UPI002577A4BA|nr:site-specific integrase [Variovorax sp. J22R193]MDM0041894.1 site-specific integrase [Variovorax sp. J22R193]
MASIIKIGLKWRAQVRRKGYPTQTKTFSTKTLATAWARQIEGDTEKLSAGVIPKGDAWTVAKLIEVYTDEVGKSKPFGRNKAAVLKTMGVLLAKVQLADLTPDRVVEYIRTDRKVSGVTAGIDLTYLKSVLKMGRALHKIPVHPSVVDDARETLSHLGLLERGQERDRRPTTAEIEQLRGWFRAHSETLTPDHIDFILSSCFRPPSEIVGLRWEDLNREHRTILIRDRKDPKKKIGNNQIVPLLGECMAIIDRQPHPEGAEFIFPVNGDTWSTVFPRACRDLGIEDLRLYDLRHEAISRLVGTNKYSILEMMLITGHKDPKQLARYTQLRARDLHR